ncbi:MULTISPECIES: ATP synthase F0 subunit B [unclassified Streptomyces]|uniref:ATP synthase F0 subunit B n=1 Tax=unclassified Streptomyces TaxID=2593676 RepID=UPI002E810D90|nr:ATP synthase F0 subunit B [Streptomyces sp. NBC_00589]WTI35997.1 ATP synthase F0 subunit B [Streptomyces sp. NBC_00775]WUB30329.1 ATP synthase F0 subunit B [Streptomyces sp. NBC_00589]
MDVQKKLDEIVGAVGSARSMPMSASCVVNRAELLSMLEEVRQALPGSLAQAQELIGGREEMVEQARQEAERIIQTAHAERGSLISDTEVARRSQNEADRILAEARKEAEEVRAEADDYVDSKLANFEVVLTKTLGSVGRGREKLLGTGPGIDEQGYEDEDAPERSHDPETLRRNADEYVDVKLGAFEAVLAKTLEAVGRGRQKLHGRIASDDLGDLSAFGEDGTPGLHTSDSDYLAGLAELSDAPEQPAQTPEVPAQPSYGQQDAYAYQQQADPYGYQQQYAQQDAYGYQQADPYAAYPQQQGYDQQPAYDQSGQQAYAQPQAHAMDQQAHSLDETSLFDTSMISAEQLRAYEQGRGGH